MRTPCCVYLVYAELLASTFKNQTPNPTSGDLDRTNSLEPLKPSCFLQPISQTDVTDIDELDANRLNKRLRFMQKLRNDFRQRFRSEYLTLLIQRGKDMKGSLKIGDVVLVETEEKRLRWPLGVIVDIFTGRDSVNRTAKVKMSTGFKVRPCQRLYMPWKFLTPRRKTMIGLRQGHHPYGTGSKTSY